MAKVPDLFEDLKNCYSEHEDYCSEVDHLSLNQKSFYDTICDPAHEKYMDDFMSLRTFDASETSSLTFKSSTVMVAANGKILKKRRLHLNQFSTDNALEAIANNPEEEIIKPMSVSYNFQSNVTYKFLRTIKHQFILTDDINQYVIKEDRYLSAASLQNMDFAAKFDMSSYISSNDDFNRIVTLQISKTQLFVSAQKENEPVLLKEVPDTPKIIKDDTSLLFFWESVGSRDYFRSVAHPTLYIATKREALVHLAHGSPSIIDLRIDDSI